MHRRTFLFTSVIGLPACFGGCLDSETNAPEEECFEIDHQSEVDRNDQAEPDRTQCYDMLELRLVYLEDRVEWADEDVEIVHSSDERIVDLPILQNLLDEGVETPPEDRLWYRHDGEDFDSVEYTDTFENVDEEDELIEAITDLPCEVVESAPSGPYVEHEGQRFALQLETWTECEE